MQTDKIRAAATASKGRSSGDEQQDGWWDTVVGTLIRRYVHMLDTDEQREDEPNIPARRDGSRLATVALVLGSLLLAAGAASAQYEERTQSRVSLGPTIGFFRSQDADAARAMWGAAMRFKLSNQLGVEGSLNYRQEEYSGGAVSVKSWPVMVTGLLYPVPILYGAMGVGWYNSAIEYRVAPGTVFASETMQQFGWHFGGGLELPLGSSAKIVGDVRYVFLNYDFQKLPGSSSVKSNFYIIDVGVLFAL